MQLGIVSEANCFLDAEFNRAVDRWSKTNSLEDAEELIGLALLIDRLDHPQAERAGLALIERVEDDDARLQFVRRVLNRTSDLENTTLPVEEAHIRVEIAKRKRLLDLNPRDALRLADSALLYANLGQRRSAFSLLKRALILRPDDRYVLRAASRFFVHIGEPERALHFLNASRATRSDPWLKAALFAVQAASGVASAGWRKAKTLLSDASFSSRDLSELAVQMGSMEYDGGSRKQAIRMLRQGAISPTENAIAQIGWVARHRTGLKHADINVDISLSKEASAYTAYEKSQWASAIAHCSDWRKIEPFSARPAILATFIGCVSAEGLEEAATVGAYGLMANPKHKTLLNNLAAVRALQGRLEDARSLVARAQASPGDDDDDVIVTATNGLINFREGKYEEGGARYIEAIEKALQNKNRPLAFRAIYYLSREVSRVDPDHGQKLLDKVDCDLELASKKGLAIPKDIEVIRGQVDKDRKMVAGDAIAPSSALSVRWDDVIGHAGTRLLEDD
ncbi:hypothetical protein [Agrobacterium larrymoorei]|uniref:tetratricopeptide repeat protein n=1 Tax=Agrobacterium larrymoorei TaxID=160699 RepID=UPI0030BCA21C